MPDAQIICGEWVVWEDHRHPPKREGVGPPPPGALMPRGGLTPSHAGLEFFFLEDRTARPHTGASPGCNPTILSYVTRALD